MNTRYKVNAVGSFWEVFDTVEKITVFVSEDINSAFKKADQMNSGVFIDEEEPEF